MQTFFTLTAILVLCALSPPTLSASDKNKVMLIILDGFKWNYIDIYPNETTTLRQIVNDGVRAESLTPSFPSVTCPCLTTIFTGMYTENHGILSNFPYDVKNHKTLSSHSIFPYCYKNMWQAKHVIDIISDGGLKSESFPRNVFDQLFLNNRNLLMTGAKQLVEDDADFVSVYIETVDSKGHEYGPTSNLLAKEIKKIDSDIKSALQYLKSTQIFNKTNFIFVSDHGLAAADPVNRVIKIEDCINVTDIRHMDPSVAGTIFPAPRTNISDVYNRLKSCHPNLTVYWKDDVPERFKYKNNSRVGPIVFMVDEGWQTTFPMDLRVQVFWDYRKLTRGRHGYDNQLESMGAIFFAKGPGFKKGYKSSKFHMVNVCPIVLQLLGITPPSNIDGSLNNVKHILSTL